MMYNSDSSEEKMDRARRRAQKLIDSANYGSMETIANLIVERNALREECDVLRRAAQSGIMAEIVDHQFNSLVMHINDSLDRLPEDAKATSAFKYAMTNFKELTEYIGLFSAASFSRGRNYQTITGKSLREYIQSFFHQPLKTGALEIQFDPAFDSFSTCIDTSRITPVLVNLVQNAYYWASQGDKKPPVVRIAMHDATTVTVSDSGSGVAADDIPNLFKLMFTRRARGGRGLGLYLGRLHMETNGGSLEYWSNYEGGLGGATFAMIFKR